jgi:DNA polymerase zeta
MYDGKAKFVARITLVKGVPFYGFHVGYRYYLKIYMLNPMAMTRLADLLRQGIIMKKVFQPYEAHLQYLLQWMTDYNLYGCGYIDCRKVKFRSPVPRYDETDDLSHLWHDRSIADELITEEAKLPRVSHCSIEVDISVQDILNRQDVKPRPLHHDFVERLNSLAPDEKLVHSMAGLWRDETLRRKSRMSNPAPGSSPFPPEVLISMSADPRNSQPGGWIHEQEYREKLISLVQDERHKSDGAKVSFNTFVKTTPFESSVKTALESVEDLFPENLRPALGLTPGGDSSAAAYEPDETEERMVDENRILGFTNDEDDDFPYDSDEEAMRELQLSQKRQAEETKENYLDPGAGGQMEYSFNDVSRPRGELYGEESLGLAGPSNSEDYAVPSVDVTLGSAGNIEGHSDGKHRTAKPTSLGDDSEQNRLDRSGTNHKRLEAPFQSSADGLGKRRKVIQEFSSASQPSGLSLRSNTGSNHTAVTQPTSTSVIGALSRTSRLANSKPLQDPSRTTDKLQTQPLLFPVVKDPQDPSTIQRLSQRSASQASPSKKLRRASFEPFLSYSDDQNHKQTSIFSETRWSPARSSTLIAGVMKKMKDQFRKDSYGMFLAIREPPPPRVSAVSTMPDLGLPSMIYQDAFYSKEFDVPERAREWAGREFKLESLTVPFLPDFDRTGTSEASRGEKHGTLPDRAKDEENHRVRRRNCGLRSWEIAEPPPTYAEVEEWSHVEKRQRKAASAKKTAEVLAAGTPQKKGKLSQIDEPTQKDKHGFKYTQNQETTSVKHEAQYMSTMSLEVHVNTRGNLVPNPEEDEVQCVFWCLQSDEDGLESNGIAEGTHLGIVTLSEDGSMAQKIAKQVACEVQEESSELDLIVRMVEIVRSYDPDILTGYEVHGSSWGYLIERARLKYDYNLCDEFSRMKAQSHGRFGKENDKWGFNQTSTIRVTGRHMINIWRAMRSELNLLQYTIENVAFHLLHRRVPHFSWADLTNWFTNGKPGDLAKTVNYYVSRVQLNLEILEQNELIPRTSEQARLLGVDFFSVFSRGSQFKVESLMFRIAKPENFLLVSPSRKQVGGQNALECLPLVMEPQSAFYNSPLLVLDFQSLYPSVMIAYNYCYSTFLGRVVNWRGTNKMGFTEFKRQQRLLELLKDHINIAPNGMMYTKPDIRKSLLAKMLGEILETRVMVKSGMKIDKDDKALQRLLNNRQLALKLIANVTYGYTSASFSGRMPCSEIADSIVQTGRETLERAIALIHSVKRWGAEVVYGDTDSLFVYLKGRTKDEAFDIGEEIAKTVTNMNPRPVKLKFEKVYLPCVLLAKKRYVGFKYESRNQTEPDFDAKGIETVRRDGTPAEQKIEEKALKILFRTADLSEVKNYFQNQCEKIMKGSVSVQDFCFAREVKLGTYSDKGPPPPGALISTKRMLEDARAEPQYGERVPYVVITGAPGARLIDRCVAPEELLESDHCELDAEYYISKNLIPPLERIFNLVGANVRNWYDEMPKVQRIRRVDANLQLQGYSKELATNKKTLESYMKASSCLVCKGKLEVEGAICPRCLADKPTSLLSLRTRVNKAERRMLDLQRVCHSCSGLSPLDEVKCDSKDCPVFYSRTRQNAKLKTERGMVDPVIRELSTSIIDMGDLDW